MSYEGLTSNKSSLEPHLGGNIAEGDPFTFCPSVWDYVIKRFSVRTILDLGSGLGYSASYFHAVGMRVIAVDGLRENCLSAVFPTFQADLTQSPVVTRVDLVHCHEFVEHIAEEHLENVLQSLTCGRFILMTHGVPGQSGHHHVNLQPQEYWISHLKRYDCSLLVEDTKRVRQLAAGDGALYLQRTGMLFVNAKYSL
jgi:SAM-dependent methyltransferase